MTLNIVPPALKLLLIIKHLNGLGTAWSIHRVVHWLQERGIDIGYTFATFSHGPYSRELEQDLGLLKMLGLISYMEDVVNNSRLYRLVLTKRGMKIAESVEAMDPETTSKVRKILSAIIRDLRSKFENRVDRE
ncbi:MAG: hypothetical protein DRO15_00925 [Thermoprotei archaeon]|nr:MAG: hypothetical protein DRO15_00925 [Thermoprotei archaeon]